MQNPDNLRVTEQARHLARLVYEKTESLPSAERFGLTAQMRRAAVSVGSNICEGCGRHGNRELTRFLQFAYGSLSELQFQSILAGDLKLLAPEQCSVLVDEVTRLKKMLARLLTALRKREQR